jgi:aldose 1-epimerase
MRKEHLGKMPSGEDVDLYTLFNKHSLEARIINYGGIIVSLRVPDRQGRLADIVTPMIVN